MMIEDELFKELDAVVLDLLTTAADKRKEASKWTFSQGFARHAAMIRTACTLESAARETAYTAYNVDRISYDVYQTIRNIIDFIGTDMNMEERLA